MYPLAHPLPRHAAQSGPTDTFFVSLCLSLFLGFLVLLAVAIR
jgi:hypothetical protein